MALDVREGTPEQFKFARIRMGSQGLGVPPLIMGMQAEAFQSGRGYD